MKKLALTLTAGTIAALVLTTTLAAPALAVTGNTGDTSAVVSGGALSETITGISLSGVSLDGKTIKHAMATTPALSAWSITDARGTGETWALSATSTDFVSPAGSVDTSIRTIDAKNLAITLGTATAAAGSDAAPTPASTAISLSSTATTLISAAADTKGTFTLVPSYDLSVPVNAYRSNYAGAINGSAQLPYVATVTYTIG
jgi:hypothetical protein